MKGFTLVWVVGMIRASVQELWRDVLGGDRSHVISSGCGEEFMAGFCASGFDGV